ncbi:MAG: LptF/LptG family permease [Chitinophagaceae bacterium]|nr:LptF/LptG family permease [Chitinophagaceae bacterium]
MIKKIDWYIIKKFISTTLFMVLMFSVIAMVIDASEKTDDFVKSGLSTYRIFTDYFAGFVPFIISMIFPLMTFIAVIFFTSKMSGRSEIVAILSGGVPFNRFLRPYFIAAFIMGGIFWYATQYLIPKANVIRGNFQAKYIDSKSSYEIGQFYGKGSNFYIRIDSNTFAGLRNYDTGSRAATSGFFLHRIEKNKVVYNLRADYLKWDTAKKGWKLENAVERKINGLQETVRVIPQMDIKLNAKPGEIRPDKYLKDKMTTPELKTFIQAEELRGSEGLNDYKVERYRRDANPFSLFILTMIGAVLGSRKTRGGSGLHLAMGFVMAALFVVMDKFSLSFSTKGDFPPALAAWMPNIIFTVVAVWLYRTSPK